MTKKPDIIEDSVTIALLPKSDGFTCAILENDANWKMSSEKYEFIITIARGLVQLARTEPEKVYRTGVKAFAEDRKETQPKTNIVDFLEHLKKKRDEEQFEEEITDPF